MTQQSIRCYEALSIMRPEASWRKRGYGGIQFQRRLVQVRVITAICSSSLIGVAVVRIMFLKQAQCMSDCLKSHRDYQITKALPTAGQTFFRYTLTILDRAFNRCGVAERRCASHDSHCHIISTNELTHVLHIRV